MTEPSGYELEAWRDIQRFEGRPLSRVMRNAGEPLATGAAKISERASRYLEKSPRTRSTVSRGRQIVARGAGARRAADAVPDGVADWSGAALGSIRQTVGRVSRVGLSPKRVVARHRKLGHDVGSLSDLRRLDLEQIDAVHGRGARLYYPAVAAASGAGAGLAISGGALVTAASAGAAAAPSAGAIAGALAGEEASGPSADDVTDDAPDEAISVLGELAEAGGPDLP